METKANNVLIGLFLLMVLAGSFLLIYRAQSQKAGEMRPYEIVFRGPVNGLSTASKVRFNGLVVGQVKKIAIDPEDGRNTKVAVVIGAHVPLRENSEARLKSQILTGAADITITPGTPIVPRLFAASSTDVLRIKAAPVPEQSLLSGAPTLVNNMNALVVRMNDLVANNERLVSETLDNVRGFTSTLEKNKDELAVAMVNTRKITEQMRDDLKEVMGSAKVITRKVEKDVTGMMQGARQMTENLSQASGKIVTLIEDNRQSLGKTLQNLEDVSTALASKKADMQAVITNTRELTRNAAQVTDNVNRLIENNQQNLTQTLTNTRKMTEQLGKDTTEVMGGVKTLTHSLNQTAVKVAGLVSANEGAIGRTVNNLETVSASLAAKKEDIGAIITHARQLTGQLDRLVLENGKTLTAALGNLQNFTLVLDENKQAVGESLQNVQAITRKFRVTAAKIDKTVSDFSGMVDGVQGKTIFKEAQEAVSAFKRLAVKLDKSVGNGAGKLTQSLQGGAEDFQLFMRDARQVVQTMNNVIEKIENNALLGGTGVKEYQRN